MSDQKLGVGDRFRDKLFRTVFPRAGEARQSNAAYYKRRAEEEAAEEKALAAQDAEEEAANKRSKDAAAYKKRADIGQAAAEEISKSRKNLSRAGFGREENPDKLNTLIHRQVNIGDREPPSGRADYGKGAERAAARPSFQQFDSAGTRASFDPKTQIRRGNQILRKSNFTRTSRFD